jgi:hypothetical protein
MISEHGLGVVVLSDEPGPLADALAELIELVRERPSLPSPPQEFSERRTVEAFAEVLRKVLKG